MRSPICQNENTEDIDLAMQQLLYIEIPTPQVAAVKTWLQSEYQIRSDRAIISIYLDITTHDLPQGVSLDG